MAKTTQTQIQNPLLRALHRLARADIVFWLMPPIIFVLTLSTIAQQWMGLHDAHQTYFASAFFWLGPLPFPGGYIWLGLLSLSLLLKFILRSKWSRRKSGIILAHFGALILCFGGLITALSQSEYYMVIPEGSETPFIYDYIETETSFFKNNERISQDQLPFTFKILEQCDNCEIKKREELGNPYTPRELQGVAQFMGLTPKKRELKAEENFSGITAHISGTPDDQDGIYVTFQAMPKPIQIAMGEDNYIITHNKKQTKLPFSIYLDNFKKTDYPGTMMAQAYSSAVTIMDGDIEWPTIIEMNKPLRYKGYTFYQSSFEQSKMGETTILSVVKNKGRLFPYIGTLVLALGLILHLILKLRAPKEGDKA